MRLFTLVAAMLLAAPAAHAADACTTLEARTAAFEPDLKAAFELMKARDIAGARKYLPKLEAYFAAIPATMPQPARCGAEVAVFDYHQYLRFTELTGAGKTVPGYPAGTKFTFKLLDLNALAYAVGWLNYENQNFDKALAAYTKGLSIAPGDHDLSSEYVATLMQQKNYAPIIPFADTYLSGDTDISPKARASMMGGKAIAQTLTGNKAGGRATLEAAVKLDPQNQTLKDLLAQWQ